ncbi:MAG TPA: ABC transporter substrate-binding protein, partial [Candidatus Saccharimonadales bacterium]|nr:ABC transporter substrate-binding protein [Candidatus Saccharimonadales bacterium]
MFNLFKRVLTIQGATFFLALGALLVLPMMATAAEVPRAGGELVFAVGETPPSFDGHRETTFGMLHPIAPHYSTLLRFDPQNYPKIVGDVAETWSFSKDGLTLTVQIRKGIKFHDGTALT